MPLREVAFDTETTGLDPKSGHRVIEIACVEMIDRIATGRKWDTLINPERSIPAEVTKVHGRTDNDVKDAPKFSEIAQDFLDFVGDAPLVAHNAPFDYKFMNSEMEICGLPPLKNKMVDTLKIAREQRPRAQNSIDALCRHFNIDLSRRVKHEALIDTELLVAVYYKLGQKMESFNFFEGEDKKDIIVKRPFRNTGILTASSEECNQHMDYIKSKIKSSLWLS